MSGAGLDEDAILQEVRSDLEAARAVMADPATTSYYAEAHLVRAWARLLTWIDPSWRYDGRQEGLLERVRDGVLPWPARAGERARVEATLAALIEGGRRGGADSRQRLSGHIVSLEGLVDELERGRAGAAGEPPVGARQRRLARLSRVLLGAVPLVPLALWLGGRALDEGRWRLTYWRAAANEVEEVLDAEASGVSPARGVDVSLSTDENSSALVPAQDGSDGRFELAADQALTLRWETCLVLDAPARYVFQLSADAPAQLEIDGARRLAVESRGHARRRPMQRARSRATADGVSLAAGVHSLRVTARGLTPGHRLALTASRSGELPRPLPARLLRAPSDDPLDPCGRGS